MTMTHTLPGTDPVGVCPNCGRRQGWDGHPYAPCGESQHAPCPTHAGQFFHKSGGYCSCGANHLHDSSRDLEEGPRGY